MIKYLDTTKPRDSITRPMLFALTSLQLEFKWPTHPNPPTPPPPTQPCPISYNNTLQHAHGLTSLSRTLYGNLLVSAFECKTTVLYGPFVGGCVKGKHGNYFPWEETHVSFFPLTLATRGTLLVNTALFIVFFYHKIAHCKQSSSSSSLQLGRK